MQIRHNSVFVNFNSSFHVLEKTDYSLIIADEEIPEILVNFPAQRADYVCENNSVIPLVLNTIHSTLRNEYITLRFFKLRDITYRFDILGFYYLGDNVPKPQLDLFIDFGNKVMEVLHRKLSTKKVLDRLDWVEAILPAIPPPTFKDKMRVFFNRLFKGSSEDLQEARPMKILSFPFMSNINLEIVVKHAIDEVERYYLVEDSKTLHNTNAFMVFKVTCTKNAFEDEAQVILGI